MLKKAPFGFLLVIILLSSLSIVRIRIYFNTTKATDHRNSGTPVGGLIDSNTTWTFDMSPYIVVQDVFIEENVF